MKKPLSIILLSALMVALTATGCSNPVGDLIQPSGSANASSAEPTVQPTDTPATASTQDRQYTAMELADMSLDEIKALMGGEYTSEHVQLSNAFSSDGTSYVFNYAVLPGFAFETYENDYRGISIMDGAKLDDRISSDMTYTQIADMIGEMDGRIIGQEGNIVCTQIMNGYQVSFCFIENEYIHSNKESAGRVSGSVLRNGNPALQSIGLLREPPVTPTEAPETEPEPEPTQAPAESAYSSYLGSWSHTDEPNEIPEEVRNNETAYKTFMNRLITTSLKMKEINGNMATFELTRGNIVAIADTTVTAEITDGTIDFTYTDSWFNQGHGTITLNGDSVYVSCQEDQSGHNARAHLTCDVVLTR